LSNGESFGEEGRGQKPEILRMELIAIKYQHKTNDTHIRLKIIS